MPRDVPLGQVNAVIGKGTLLVRAPGPLPVRAPGLQTPPGPSVRIGSPVVDAVHAHVGRVMDVIGPVSRPFVVVSPAQGARLHRLQGKDVFATEGQPGRRRPPHGGRGRRR